MARLPAAPDVLIRRLGRLLALASAVVGVLVLCGWVLDLAWLTQLHPSWVSMKANTALGFTVAGTVLYLRHRQERVTLSFRMAAGFLALLGLFTLAQYVFGLNLGIDQWLFQEDSAAKATSHPGRMSPATALCFLLLGLAMLLRDSASDAGKNVAPWLGQTIALIAFLAILGYSYGVQSLYQVATFTSMALHTASAFMALSLALMSLDTERGPMRILASPATGGLMARRLFPVVFVLPLVLGWLHLQGQELGWYDTNIGVALSTLFTVLLLALLVLHSARLMNEQDASLQAQNRLQALILASMSEGVVVTNAHGRFQLFNPAAEATLGLGPTQSPIEEWNRYCGAFHPESMNPYRPEEIPLSRSLQGEMIDDEEQFIRNSQRPDGLFISVSARPLHNAQDEIVGAVAVFHDVTEKRRAETALAQAAAELRERNAEIVTKNSALENASRLKSEFLATMSHELRTPLNAIIGFSEVLKDGLGGTLSEQQAEYVDEVFDSAQHLLALINDILDLSKVEAGKMELETEPLAVAELLRGSLSIIKEQALRNHIALTLDLTGAPVHVIADARKLKQILYNLLSNAVKFTPEGGRVGVSARAVSREALRQVAPAGMALRQLPLPDSDWQEFLEIKVCDSGMGMPAAVLDQLFQPFMQVDASLARNFEGTGLGLALVKRMTELHGGTVAVASAPGQGTCLTVWLPCRTEGGCVENTGGSEHSHALSEQATAIPTEAAAAKHALVIEDDPAAAELLRLYLQGASFSVARAPDAEQGLAMAAAERPDLITLDLLLPHMSGWEALARLKANPELARVPVVIVSIVAERKLGVALGAAEVLQKPLRRRDLLDALHELGLSEKQGRPYSVLAVDDNPTMLTLLTSYLSAAKNCTLLTASSGREALDRIRQSLPDVLILDLMMPGLSGFDVIDELKADPATAALPILILTAKTITAADRERLNGQVLKIMEKGSFKREHFLNEVQRAVGGR